jgi:hypothetical protein
VAINASAPEESLACLRSINSVRPDANGNITFIGQKCLQILPEEEAHTLVFRDTCAEPCCSCAELAPIEAKIKEISSSINQLSSRMETLRSQQEFMRQSLLASS